MPGQPAASGPPNARHALTPAELVRMNAARRQGTPLLTWRDGEGELQILHLEDAAGYPVGRQSTMTVALGWDPKVSKLHAKLECLGGEWVVVDDGLSRNGTWVNGRRIRASVRLRDADVIRVGTCLLAFHAAGERREFASTVLEDAEDAAPAFDDLDRALLVELCRDYLVHERPTPVDSNRIAQRLGYGVDMVKNRLRDMYKACDIDPRNELPRGAKRAELMALAIRHGVVSMRDYDPPRRSEER
jgi:hypothetical protein